MSDEHTPLNPNRLEALKALQSQIQLKHQPLPILVNPRIELERKRQKTLDALYQLQFKQEAERNLQIKAQQRMIETHKQIIQALINDFDAGETGVNAEALSNKLGLDLHTVKYCLKLLFESGCIKLVESRPLSGSEQILVTRIESKSYMVLKGEVPLDNSGTKPGIYMENSNYIAHSNNINGNHTS
jgi:predicted transcriptional regulator